MKIWSGGSFLLLWGQFREGFLALEVTVGTLHPSQKPFSVTGLGLSQDKDES